jgi:hypothetical protein
MLLSAEIRWFWKTAPPNNLREWFCESKAHSVPPGGGRVRTDRYLWDPDQREMGIKRRGGEKGVEVKGLVMLAADVTLPIGFRGSVEIWSKWTSHGLKLDAGSTIALKKRRWLRKFDTNSRVPQEIELDDYEQPARMDQLPKAGCNVELTQLRIPNGDEWWTLGFEAFGAMQTLRQNLRSTAEILVKRKPPKFQSAVLANYPTWLSEYAS